MTPVEIQTHLDSCRKACKEEGMRITPQKIRIYEILLHSHDHPTAEDIYKRLKKDFPKVSFATVYDNLRKFKKMKLIQEMGTEEGPSRFEANMHDHHHVIDSTTGEVLDIDLDHGQDIPIPKSLQKKQIKSIKITYVL